MTTRQAIAIAEGLTEVETEEEYLSAWQHLVNTDLAWTLQGWFGRMAMRLIEAGQITPKEK